MEAEVLAEQARNSISSFCYEECGAYCCRKGYLVLSEKEADEVSHGKRVELERSGCIKKLEDGSYSLSLSKSDGCPSLKDFKCTIHTSALRPRACRLFPIFVSGNKVRISQRCPALRAGKLYPFVSEFRRLGFEVVDNIPFSEQEFSDATLDGKI